MTSVMKWVKFLLEYFLHVNLLCERELVHHINQMDPLSVFNTSNKEFRPIFTS